MLLFNENNYHYQMYTNIYVYITHAILTKLRQYIKCYFIIIYLLSYFMWQALGPSINPKAPVVPLEGR